MDTAERWIEVLELEPHPEGGWYRETYRSDLRIGSCCLPDLPAEGRRSASTAIYFLLRGDEFSSLHRLRSDEVWHHYRGGTLVVHVLHPDGSYVPIRLGPDLSGGERPQAVVPAGCWFGATLGDPNGFALAGCTVAPGFDFRDFQIGKRDELLREFPRHRRLVEGLTRV